MTSRSCSTSSSVLPKSRSFANAAISRRLSRGMQSDRRLVQHVQHAGQSAADLACQANTLRFASGERRRAAASVRYSRPTSTRNCKRLRISLSSSPAILRSRRGQLPIDEFGQQRSQRLLAVLVQRVFLKAHRGGVVAQPAAAAGRTFDFIDQMIQLVRGTRSTAATLLPTPDRDPCIESETCGRALARRFPGGRHVDPGFAAAVQIRSGAARGVSCSKGTSSGTSGLRGKRRRASARKAVFETVATKPPLRRLASAFELCSSAAGLAHLDSPVLHRQGTSPNAVERKAVRRQAFEAAAAAIAGKMLAVDLG